VEIAFEEVQIDRCGKCNGVWLEAGELERLTRQEGVWLSSFWKSLAG
jgi:Zn-finger nucleic acid-binding protein